MTFPQTGVTPSLMGLAVRGTLLLLIGWGGAQMLRRAPASARHLIWLSVIAGALMLPGLTSVGSVRVAILPSTSLPAEREERAAGATAPVSFHSESANDAATPDVAPMARTSGGASEHSAPSAWSLAGSLWLGIAGLLIASFLAGLYSIRGILRASRVVESPEWRDALTDACARLDLGSTPRLVVSDQVEMAFTCNVLRPTIVLPRGSDEWSHDRRRAVLLHEVAHVRRRDLIGHTAAGVACAVYWFNPLVWLAARRLRVESELACDDLVLDAGVRASDYAQHLLELVTALARRQTAPVGALAIVSSKDFEGRLIAILDRANRRASPMGRTHVTALLSVVVPVTLSIAAVVPTPRVYEGGRLTPPVIADTLHPAVTTRPSRSGATPSKAMTMTPVSTASTRVVDRPAIGQSEAPVVADAEDVLAGCPMRLSHSNSDAAGSGSDQTWTASGSNDACRFDFSSQGDIVFNRDVTAIEQISPNGFIDVTTNIRGDLTRLVVRSSTEGALQYELTRNGVPVDFTVAGAAWLEQFLICLDRTTAFAIDRRLPELLQAGGLDLVLAEVARMHTDHAQATYLRRLIQVAPFDAAEIRQTGDIVSSMSPDHDAGEVVVAIATRYALADAGARASLLKTALALEIDHERVQAILAIVARATLAREETSAILGAVPRMRVDNDKARVLLALADTRHLDEDLRAALVVAAESIRDARERARTVAALARH